MTGNSKGENRNLNVDVEGSRPSRNGRVLISGAEAIPRILLVRKALDKAAGLNTAGYVTGYRGSPLGNVDNALWTAGPDLRSADILFQPGLNEDIAATAVRGTQQLEAVPGPRFDGVFAAWYGKGPGVDRSGDAMKHGNYSGTHRHGGVLVFYGDDHASKSSTVAHASEAALAAHLIPSLYPADVGELLKFGQLGFALSRYSGLWIGMKCVNEVAEQTATVSADLDKVRVQLPEASAHDVNIRPRAAFNPLGEEQIVVDHRLPRVHAFVRANGIDQVLIDAPRRSIGIVAAGKSAGDVRAALGLLGLSEDSAAELGISFYKPGCIWPLEPQGLTAFAQGQKTLLIVEEKRPFLESQIASILINHERRPLLIGKLDERGNSLLSPSLPFEPAMLAEVIAGRLELAELATDPVRAALDRLRADVALPGAGLVRRTPYFCSGCPHSRSTKVPEGSLSMTGIGCHTMVALTRPDIALQPTHMGGEGANWIGLAPFTNTRHMFQNMGDGTYFHSGLLALRAAIAAGVNITYKILYNDAVAMTGGQPIDGTLSVSDMARQILAEGVARVVVVSEDPARHEDSGLPSAVSLYHRDRLDEVQQTLRNTPGCTVLIYEQTCAAEKRRRRKRGTLADPDKRQFIVEGVCEGCGDCSVQSTCVSLIPVDTPFGRKRAIDQASCNKDYSCVDGFCPSFVTVKGARLRKSQTAAFDDALLEALPLPPTPPANADCNILVAGIGGNGVVTIGALIGMAAHIEGKAASMFDMTGLSQKNGAVYSHVRLSSDHGQLNAARIGRGEADLILALDLVASAAPESAATIMTGRTAVVANMTTSPTVAFQFDRNAVVDGSSLARQIETAVADGSFLAADASGVAAALLGDAIGANLFIVGFAAQRGLLPIGCEAIESAIALNGVAVSLNSRAFRLGRLFSHHPAQMNALVDQLRDKQHIPVSLGDVISHRSSHLALYQNEALTVRYRTLLDRVHLREMEVMPSSDAITRTVATIYAKLLSYKDEYEIARLLTDDAMNRQINEAFGLGARISYNLAPPFLNRKQVNGRPAKREFGPWLRPVLDLLAKLKWLRGTWADPFGYTHERRMERKLIIDYENLVDTVLPVITQENCEVAAGILKEAGEIKGFGPVKADAIRNYYASVNQQLAKLCAARHDVP